MAVLLQFLHPPRLPQVCPWGVTLVLTAFMSQVLADSSCGDYVRLAWPYDCRQHSCMHGVPHEKPLVPYVLPALL